MGKQPKLAWVLVDGLPRRVEEFKVAPRPVEPRCPLCDERVVLKLGSIRIAHAAHYAGSPECSPESIEHLNAKYALRRYWEQHLGEPVAYEQLCPGTSPAGCKEPVGRTLEWRGAWDEVRLEHPIGKWRADVALLFEGEVVAVFEIWVTNRLSDEKVEDLDRLAVAWWETRAELILEDGEEVIKADRTSLTLIADKCGGCSERLARRHQRTSRLREACEEIIGVLRKNLFKVDVLGDTDFIAAKEGRKRTAMLVRQGLPPELDIELQTRAFAEQGVEKVCWFIFGRDVGTQNSKGQPQFAIRAWKGTLWVSNAGKYTPLSQFVAGLANKEVKRCDGVWSRRGQVVTVSVSLLSCVCGAQSVLHVSRPRVFGCCGASPRSFPSEDVLSRAWAILKSERGVGRATLVSGSTDSGWRCSNCPRIFPREQVAEKRSLAIVMSKPALLENRTHWCQAKDGQWCRRSP